MGEVQTAAAHNDTPLLAGKHLVGPRPPDGDRPGARTSGPWYFVNGARVPVVGARIQGAGEATGPCGAAAAERDAELGRDGCWTRSSFRGRLDLKVHLACLWIERDQRTIIRRQKGTTAELTPVPDPGQRSTVNADAPRPHAG